jgi:hypothetical protein
MFFRVFFDFSHYPPFFRLFTLFAAPAIELKQTTLRCFWQQKRRNWYHTFTGTYFIINKILLPKQRFDLKSNRQYFDLKSHLDHARKGYIVRFPQCSGQFFLIPGPIIGIRPLWLVSYSRYLWLSNIRQFCLHFFHLTYLPKIREN